MQKALLVVITAPLIVVGFVAGLVFVGLSSGFYAAYKWSAKVSGAKIEETP